MGNYITEKKQLVFPNGKLCRLYLDGKITEQEKDTALDQIIINAENWVNDQIRGSTVVPALHMASQCKMIALEYAYFLVLRDNYLFYGVEQVKSKSDLYLYEAKRLIKELSYEASASVPVALTQNTGDGVISVVTVESECTITEAWSIIFNGEFTYDIVGSGSGYLDSGDIRDNGGTYPILEVGKIAFTITAGTTAFAQYDTFTFVTYGPSYISTGIKIIDAELSY